MKKIYYTLLVAFGLMVSSQLSAQEYTSAIGARLGYPLSISYKQFLGGSSNAIEVFGGLRGFSTYSWFTVGGLYQIHKPIPDVDGLQWYFGGGASAYFWNFKNNFVGDTSVGTSFALLGDIGLDYKFESAPVNLSVDWVPTFFINGFGSGFGGGYGALAVRYTLK